VRIIILAAAAATLALACGCGSDRLPTAVVNGKITYKNKPVPNGSILFSPEKGPSATGDIKPDGSYTLTTYRAGDGAVLGKHTVTIAAFEDTSNKLPEERPGLPTAIIPAKYESAATSGLSADVKAGENTVNFDLK
jgi:hypothetical protein